MEGLEDVLQKLLKDPAQLAELSALAQSLGLGPPEPPPEPPQPKSAPPPPPVSAAPPMPPPPPCGPFGARQEKLLLALKPFLKPSRQEKIDRALRAAQLSRLAGSALHRSGP